MHEFGLLDNLDGNKTSVYYIKMDSVVHYKLTYTLSNFSVTIDNVNLYEARNLPVV